MALLRETAERAAGTEEFWRKLAEQGWLGIVHPEEQGGSGLDLVGLAVLTEEMGRRSLPA
jgi:alkylation response protein AidB-like acyl-CoA dehydrogenase